MNLSIDDVCQAINNFRGNGDFGINYDNIKIVSQYYNYRPIGNFNVIVIDIESRVLISMCISSGEIIILHKYRTLTKKEYVAMMALIESASDFSAFIAYKILLHQYVEEYVSSDTTKIKIINTSPYLSIMIVSVDIRKVNDDTFLASNRFIY